MQIDYNMHWLISEVGGVIPTGKSDSFRSCVRASEAVHARERALCEKAARACVLARRIEDVLHHSLGSAASVWPRLLITANHC